MKDGFEAVSRYFDGKQDEMVKTMSEMIAIPAISPKSGGNGEGARADYLARLLKSWGFETRRYEYKDETGAGRPSLVATYGRAERRIWMVAHIDTVSVGDPSLWRTDPFKLHIEDGKMYGRGTMDNGQSVVAAIYAMRALKETKAGMKYAFGLVLAADEEIGSRWGMQKLMDEGIFGKEDMFVVPDAGNPEGNEIEIGEKGLLWLKITVTGKQVHASTPSMGRNAFRYSIKLLSMIDERLHSKYSKTNALFAPSASTFEMTKHEKNVESINIVPGTDVSYIDCRVLPEYKLDDVLQDIRAVAAGKEFKEVKIEVETVVREDPADATDKDAEIVRQVWQALKELRGIDAKKVGIGGGTCAAFPRKAGMQAAVWSTEDEIAHQPNEYSRISNLVGDAKVFAYLFL